MESFPRLTVRPTVAAEGSTPTTRLERPMRPPPPRPRTGRGGLGARPRRGSRRGLATGPGASDLSRPARSRPRPPTCPTAGPRALAQATTPPPAAPDPAGSAHPGVPGPAASLGAGASPVGANVPHALSGPASCPPGPGERRSWDGPHGSLTTPPGSRLQVLVPATINCLQPSGPDGRRPCKGDEPGDPSPPTARSG